MTGAAVSAVVVAGPVVVGASLATGSVVTDSLAVGGFSVESGADASLPLVQDTATRPKANTVATNRRVMTITVVVTNPRRQRTSTQPRSATPVRVIAL